jgi:hypothetical protein
LDTAQKIVEMLVIALVAADFFTSWDDFIACQRHSNNGPGSRPHLRQHCTTNGAEKTGGHTGGHQDWMNPCTVVIALQCVLDCNGQPANGGVYNFPCFTEAFFAAKSDSAGVRSRHEDGNTKPRQIPAPWCGGFILTYWANLLALHDWTPASQALEATKVLTQLGIRFKTDQGAVDAVPIIIAALSASAGADVAGV